MAQNSTTIRAAGLATPYDWFLGALLVVAVILAYQPVWFAGYIWDDDVVLTANPVIVGPQGLKEIWTTTAADICPLTLTTFWIEYQLWGANPLPYHLVNVALHAGVAILLWLVLRKLTVPGAWLGAALWALHPVQAESVAWISELKNTQSGIFFLLAILFYLRSFRPGDTSRGDYGWSLAFSAMAMASKSSTVILPLIMGLCAWWIERRFEWRRLLGLAPVFLMSIAMGVVSMVTQQIRGANDPAFARPWAERLAAAGDAPWFYLYKLLWPHTLLTIYPKWIIDTSSPLAYVPLVLVVALLGVLWWWRSGWARPWFFAFGYFVVALLPVLGLIDNSIFRYGIVYDHLQYLPSMGPIALAGAGLWMLPRVVAWNRAGIGVAAALALFLGFLTWRQTWIYENKFTLWQHTLASNPFCTPALNNLGILYTDAGDFDNAIAVFQRALEIDPQYPEAHSNSGIVYMKQGRLTEAEAEFQKAVDAYPMYPTAQQDLCLTLAQLGRMDEAIAAAENALKLNGDWDEIRGNLGALYGQKGRVDDAIEQFRIVLAHDFKNVNAHSNLSNALLDKGNIDGALSELHIALQLQPEVPQAHYNLGNILARKGEFKEAIEQYQEALKLKPDYALAKAGLAAAQAHGNDPAPK